MARIPFFSVLQLNDNMKTSDEMRRENLDRLMREHGGVKKFSGFLEMSSSQLSQWLNASKDSKTDRRRGISGDSARAIEEKTGKPRGWMDNDHTIDTSESVVEGKPENGLSVIKPLALVPDQNPDERILINGFRVADAVRRDLLMDIAKKAIEIDRLRLRSETQ